MRFATSSLLLVWSANGLIITPCTLLLGWRRRQKRLVQCIPNNCGHLCDGISGVLIEWDDDFGESARRSAKIQTSILLELYQLIAFGSQVHHYIVLVATDFVAKLHEQGGLTRSLAADRQINAPS